MAPRSRAASRPDRTAAARAPAGARAQAAARGSRPRPPEPRAPRWWKGNLHAHSLWSDGDDFPEMVAGWYLRQGYHFLVLSDHNVLSIGRKWIDPAESRHGLEALARCRQRYGDDWVETREQDGRTLVRLKPLTEFRHLFERPDEFLLLQGEEISDSFGDAQIHLNAIHTQHPVAPQRGRSIHGVVQTNVNAVLAQRFETGQPMVPTVNHPNFAWALTAEDLLKVEGLTLFEVFNGHPAVRNYGDAAHASTERLWDIVLAHRLGGGQGRPIFGVAVDDSHHYHEFGTRKANPGRGWIVVRAPRLTPEAILAALEAGDFYASTGVGLDDVQCDGAGLRLHIRPEKGVSYLTEFIGTLGDFDHRSERVLGPNAEPLRATRRYSADIGHVLAEAEGTAPAYTFAGDELYVRARVISSKPKANPFEPGDVEVAWSQPVVPPRRRG